MIITYQELLEDELSRRIVREALEDELSRRLALESFIPQSQGWHGSALWKRSALETRLTPEKENAEGEGWKVTRDFLRLQWKQTSESN